MEEMAGIICALAAELYNQCLAQIDNAEEAESFSLSAESKDGYCYKVTISREGKEEDEE